MGWDYRTWRKQNNIWHCITWYNMAWHGMKWNGITWNWGDKFQNNLWSCVGWRVQKGNYRKDFKSWSFERWPFVRVNNLFPSLWRRANARNVSFETLYGRQFTLSGIGWCGSSGLRLGGTKRRYIAWIVSLYVHCVALNVLCIIFSSDNNI